MKRLLLVLISFTFTITIVNAQFSGGNGTSGNPYQISSASDLAAITGSYVTGGFYFKQTANINLTDYTNWTPIGTTSAPFNGEYNGDGYTITNLKISSTSTYRGLFGAISSGAVLKNIALTSVNVVGRNFSAALVGQNSGQVINCYATGSVTGRTPTGGLIAYSTNTGNVYNSYANCDVLGFNNVGGLIGQNEGKVSYSYANGNLTATSVSFALFGGFIGSNSGEVFQCFSGVNSESLTFGVNGGGFVGTNTSFGVIVNCYFNGTVEVDEDPDNEAVAAGFVVSNFGQISNCYARGTILGAEMGGFAFENSGTISNCFWHEDIGADDSEGGTSKSTAEMQDISTYTSAGWPFQCQVWGINGSDNNLYPFLLWQQDYSFPASDCNYWTGSSGTSWTTAGNWTTGVPSSGGSVLVRGNTSNFPVLATSATLNVANIGRDASLTIASDGHLTSTGEIVNSGVITVNPLGKITSTGSLINNNGVEGLVLKSSDAGSGTLIHSSADVLATAERYVYGNQYFHVISSPVAGQSIRNFISENSSVIAYNSTSQVYAMRHYTAGVGWSAFYPASQTGDIIPGTAYTVGHAAPGVLVFKGRLVNTTQERQLSGTGTGWNGIGNPFASGINVNSGINSFFQKYQAQFDPNYRALYIWDPATRIYQTINGVPGLAQTHLSSAQGFLVKSLSEGSTVYFETGMRAHNNPPFFKSEDEEVWYLLTLKVVNQLNRELNTSLAFNKNMITGLDVGFDAGMYTENQNYQLYSRMPNGQDELNLAIQALPDSWEETVVIPLGFLFNDGGEVFFRVTNLSLPENVKVLLEDKVLNVFTDLSTADYTVQIDPQSPPLGRFYLHVGANITSIPDIALENLRINLYPNPSNGLFFADINLDKTTNLEFLIYDISGRLVMTIPSRTYDMGMHSVPINANNLSKGVYILKTRVFDSASRSLLLEKGSKIVIK